MPCACQTVIKSQPIRRRRSPVFGFPRTGKLLRMRLDEADERLRDAGEATVAVEGRRSGLRSPVMANCSETAVIAVWNFDETIHCYVV